MTPYKDEEAKDKALLSLAAELGLLDLTERIYAGLIKSAQDDQKPYSESAVAYEYRRLT